MPPLAVAPTTATRLTMTTRDICLALLVPLIWGFNFVVMKYAVTEASPMFLVTARFLLAAVPFIFFVPKPEASWRVLIGYALLFAIIKFGLLFTAFRWGAPAGLASVVLQMQAIITVALALVLFAERPTKAEIAGLSVAAIGLAVIFSGLAGGPGVWAMALVFTAATAWSFANIVNKSAPKSNPIGFVVWTSAIAAALMLPIILVVDGVPSITATMANMSLWGWGAVLYLAYPVSLFSGAIWSRLITCYPAATVTPFALLTPAVGLLSSAIVFGERLSGTILFGTAAICIGLAIITLTPRRQPAPNLPTPSEITS
ncbi:MAG: EamA family transporter [Hyphomicrobiaceae bacterium]